MSDMSSDLGGNWELPDRFNFSRDIVEAVASHDGTWPALTFVDSVGAIRRFTFAQMHNIATRWTGLLRESGVGPGDRIIVAVGKRPDWHAVLLASMRCGAITVPCSVRASAPELDFRIRQSGASLVVAERTTHAALQHALNRLDAPPAVLYVDEIEDSLREFPRVAPCEDTASGDPAAIVYTAGVSGPPKGVVHTHGSMYGARLQAQHWLDARPDDLVWCTVPTGGADSIWNVLLGPWSCGSQIVLHEQPFDPIERCELIERLGVTVLCQTPAEYRAMTRVDGVERRDLTSVQQAVSIGDALDLETVRRFKRFFGITVREGYGQTETSIVIGQPPGLEPRLGSMGLELPGQRVAVIDDWGQEVGPGIEGEIAVQIQGPTLFQGYWDQPELTSAAFRGGWFVTGDLAIRDRDGHFSFIGRPEDVIGSDDRKVNALEAESALLEHDAVFDAAVVSKHNPLHGQVAKAFVVVRSEAPAVSTHELLEWSRRRLVPNPGPDEIEAVPELPRDESGKVRRHELRQREASRVGKDGGWWERGSTTSPEAEPNTSDSALVARLDAYAHADKHRRDPDP